MKRWKWCVGCHKEMDRVGFHCADCLKKEVEIDGKMYPKYCERISGDKCFLMQALRDIVDALIKKYYVDGKKTGPLEHLDLASDDAYVQFRDVMVKFIEDKDA